MRVDIAEDDGYFRQLRADYSRGILELVKRPADPDWLLGDPTSLTTPHNA